MQTKTCNKCNIDKSLESFSLLKSGKPVSRCKSCKMDYWRERQKILRSRNKSDIIIPDKKICIYCKQEKNGNEFYIDLTKPCGLRSECIKCHNKKIDIKRRKNPKKRAIKNMSKRYRKICRDNNLRKNETTIESLGCSGKFFAEYIEKQFKPGMSWDNYGVWHIDHVKPWAKIDINDPKQVAECRHYTNLQPLWWWENLEKGGKWENTTSQ